MPDIAPPTAQAAPHDDLATVRNRTFDELAIGDSATLERTLTTEDIQLFAVLSGDVNPQHLDADYAASTRFHGVIAHGMLGGALISAVLGTRLPGPGTIYLGQTLKFLAPVRVGDRLRISVTVSARNEAKKHLTLACSCVNQDGTAVISGEAEVVARAMALANEVLNGDGVDLGGTIAAPQMEHIARHKPFLRKQFRQG